MLKQEDSVKFLSGLRNDQSRLKSNKSSMLTFGKNSRVLWVRCIKLLPEAIGHPVEQGRASEASYLACRVYKVPAWASDGHTTGSTLYERQPEGYRSMTFCVDVMSKHKDLHSISNSV